MLRFLVLFDEPPTNGSVQRIRDLLPANVPCDLHVIVLREDDQDIHAANDQLSWVIEQLSAGSVDVHGEIAPLHVLQYHLASGPEFEPDEIVVCAPPSRILRMLNVDIVTKVQRHTDVPLSHVSEHITNRWIYRPGARVTSTTRP